MTPSTSTHSPAGCFDPRPGNENICARLSCPGDGLGIQFTIDVDRNVDPSAVEETARLDDLGFDVSLKRARWGYESALFVRGYNRPDSQEVTLDQPLADAIATAWSRLFTFSLARTAET